MTLDDAIAEVNLGYLTIKDRGEEISAQTQRIYASLSRTQEKVFGLADNLPLRKSIEVIANIKRKH